ncbi:hemerythrin domain-containing protein [Sphingomonas lycopersici]|uniref:Hemerythrin domain-containing protein n=1 Tax=Sphingomonas lycopersici TaxID=2951807 RepID=A0AA41ZE59_9SPHN|nr:hemerythrin domain-containing protein [Sphingomonas lycopersici]MCW6537672.1 hemerythrin domain-containing protein [Sphingomonas lycopersici]
MDMDGIRRQHDSISEHAGRLAAAVSNPTYSPVAAIRWKLARELIAHLAVEDRWLYPAFIASSNQRAADTAKQFKDEMGGLADVFTNYMSKWTDQRIAAEWAAYCDETKALLAALADRILRENNELYPLASAVRLAEKRRYAARPNSSQAPGRA